MANPLRRSRPPQPTSAPPIWSTRLLRLSLWALVLVGAGGGACAAARPTPTAAPPPTAPTTTAPPGLDGVAELAAREWLLDQSRPERPDLANRLTVENTSVVATRRAGVHVWTVTVAATLRHADGTPATWYLDVGVTSTTSGLRPVGAPAVVPPPADTTPLLPRSVALQVPAPDDQIASTAEAFLGALLAGRGDPVRYASPDARPFPPFGEPFTDLELERIGVLSHDGERTRIRVAVRATTPDGIAFDLVYELDLRSRDGRWEVESLSGASRPSADRTEPSSASTTSITASTVARTPGA